MVRPAQFVMIGVFCLSACTPPSQSTPIPQTTVPSQRDAQTPAVPSSDDDFCPQPRGWFIYITQPGDTLQRIADRTASTVHELATANCLQNPTRLDSGLTFYIPARPVGE